MEKTQQKKQVFIVTNTIAQSTCIQRLIPNLTTKAKQHIYPYLRDYYGLQLFNNVGT